MSYAVFEIYHLFTASIASLSIRRPFWSMELTATPIAD